MNSQFTSNTIAAVLQKPFSASTTSLSSNQSSTKSYKKKLKNRNTIKVNVSGCVFELCKKQVYQYPDSLLASAELSHYYEPSLGMYYFDRNRALFEYIVQFYQCPSDKLFIFPDDYPEEMIEGELEFYKIGWREVGEDIEDENDVEVEQTLYEGFIDMGHRFLDDPSYSITSKIYMCLDVAMIIISILQFILETEPYIANAIATNSNVRIVNLGLTWAGTVFFTADFILRLIFCKHRLRFFITFATWLDVVALVPFYIDLITYYGRNLNTNAGIYKILKVLRTARLARCFKIIRHSKQLLVIITILKGCWSELSMMLFAWLIGVLLSGSFCYFAETSLWELMGSTANPQFYSIMQGSWWAVVTISTTGYGDILPNSGLGISIATIIIFCSAIFMAIPMTIIIRKFSESYENIASEEKINKVFGKDKENVMNQIKGNNCSVIEDGEIAYINNALKIALLEDIKKGKGRKNSKMLSM